MHKHAYPQDVVFFAVFIFCTLEGDVIKKIYPHVKKYSFGVGNLFICEEG